MLNIRGIPHTLHFCLSLLCHFTLVCYFMAVNPAEQSSYLVHVIVQDDAVPCISFV